MAPNPTLIQQFQTIRSAVFRGDNQDGVRLADSMKTLSTSDQTAFRQWLMDTMATERKQKIADAQKQPALSVKDYIAALRNLNFKSVDPKDPNSLESFVAKTQVVGYTPSPAPITLGVQDGITFFIYPGEGIPDFKDDPSTARDRNRYIVQLNGDGKTQPMIKFGLCLGAVYTCQGAPNDKATQTPLHAYINPVDRSIWLILAKEYPDNIGDMIPVVGGNAWKYIGLQQSSSLPTFDAVRIYTIDDISSRSAGDSTADSIGGQRNRLFTRTESQLKQYSLTPVLASNAAVNNALAARRAAA